MHSTMYGTRIICARRLMIDQRKSSIHRTVCKNYRHFLMTAVYGYYQILIYICFRFQKWCIDQSRFSKHGIMSVQTVVTMLTTGSSTVGLCI